MEVNIRQVELLRDMLSDLIAMYSKLIRQADTAGNLQAADEYRLARTECVWMRRYLDPRDSEAILASGSIQKKFIEP